MPRANRTGTRGLYRDDGGRWRIDLRWREPSTGQFRRHRERLPDDTTAATAKQRARQLLNAALAGSFVATQDEPKRLHEALDEYLAWAKTNRPQTHLTRKSIIAVLKKHIPDRTLDELAPLDVERFKRDREKAGKAPATINRAVAQIKRLYAVAADWGWATSDQLARMRAVPKLKEPPGRIRHLTSDEEARLFAALRPGIRPIVVAASLLGMRRTEVVRLRKDAVDRERGNIKLLKTKSNRPRVLPINAALDEVLAAAMASSPPSSEFIFTQQQGRNRGKPYTPAAVTLAFRRAVVEAGIEDLHLHDMRHDFATKLRRAGVGIDVIKELLGHSNISVTMRYAHVEPALLRAAVADLVAPVAPSLPTASTDGPRKATVRR